MEILFICNRVTMKRIFLFIGCQRIVIPVALNMMLTLVCWVGIYHMKIDEIFANALFGNLGETAMDSLKNGLGSAMAFACVSFTMLAFVMLNCRRLAQFWLYIAFLLLLFVVSGMFFYAAIIGPEVKPETARSSEVLPVAFATGFYGVVGCLAYFTNLLPSWVHRIYVVCNCSLVSLYYLRVLPDDTAWIVLIGVACWEVFSTLFPCGPLNMALRKAADYNGTVLRFLMFTSGKEPVLQSTVASSSMEAPSSPAVQSDSTTSSDSFSEESEYSTGSSDWESEESEDDEVLEHISLTFGDGFSPSVTSSFSPFSRSSASDASQTAKDVLNDDSFKLGMGCFVFFSLLVGKAATSGSFLATAAAFSGVLCGLCISFVFGNDHNRRFRRLGNVDSNSRRCIGRRRETHSGENSRLLLSLASASISFLSFVPSPTGPLPRMLFSARCRLAHGLHFNGALMFLVDKVFNLFGCCRPKKSKNLKNKKKEKKTSISTVEETSANPTVCESFNANQAVTLAIRRPEEHPRLLRLLMAVRDFVVPPRMDPVLRPLISQFSFSSRNYRSVL